MPPRAVRLACVLWVCGTVGGCPDGSSGESSVDLPADFTILGRWPTTSDALPFALTYRVDASDADPDLEPAARSAAAVWNASGVVRVYPAPEGRAADVTFAFASGAHGTCRPFGWNSTLAHAGPCSPPSFVHFDRASDWSGSGHSLAVTGAHELGHLLGLGHSSTPGSLMSLEADRQGSVLDVNDLAGVHSLYGGGEDGAGDVEIRSGGELRTGLRRVAPRATTELAVLDTDADGDAEVLVWRTDQAGYGGLTIYHFDPGPKLSRTIGPLPGVALPGAPHLVGVTTDGERVFLALLEDGRWFGRVFDAAGMPLSLAAQPLRLGAWKDVDGDGRWDETPAGGVPRADAWAADLDGDGTSEALTRR